MTAQPCKQLYRVITLTGLLSLLPASQQIHAQASVDVRVNLETVTILTYRSSIDVTLSSEALSAMFAGSNIDDGDFGGNANFNGGQFEFNAAVDTSNDSNINLTAVPLRISNAWAVRAIGNNGAVTSLSIANGEGVRLANAQGGELLISGIQAVSGDQWGTGISFSPPGLTRPVNGDIVMSLDFSEATGTGLYDALDGSATFVLQATTN